VTAKPLGRYRVMAYVVGVMLLVLTVVAIPLKYAADTPGVVAVVGPIHGVLYFLYLLTVLDLARRSGWSVVRALGVMLAGAVPLLSFVVERRVSRDEQVSAQRGATRSA